VSDGLQSLAAGTAVTPNVRLVSPLGSGGMGAVWLADHTGLKTRVVVKFMHAGVDSTPSARARFSREASAAAQVKSPHVVQMLDHGVTDDGVPFIVMEHLEGRDLGKVLKEEGALEPADVVVVVSQIAKALSKVHAAGLLHRDIKPDNIFVCDTEDEIFVKLLDFGIVKKEVGEGEGSMDGSTNTGQVVGTPFYMSPEQVTAQKALDARSDLWALGVVAFEALTGKRPFDGPSFGALAVLIATGSPPKPTELNPDLPKEVDAWFLKACAREPANRFGTARELADGLRAAFGALVPPMSDSGQRNAGVRGKMASSSGSGAHDTLPTSGSPSFVNASTVVRGESALLNATGSGVVDTTAGKEDTTSRRRSHVILGSAFALAGAIGVAMLFGGPSGTVEARDGGAGVPEARPRSTPHPAKAPAAPPSGKRAEVTPAESAKAEPPPTVATTTTSLDASAIENVSLASSAPRTPPPVVPPRPSASAVPSARPSASPSASAPPSASQAHPTSHPPSSHNDPLF
jgi:eukaryotic-like serine/threonine-protein kinase